MENEKTLSDREKTLSCILKTIVIVSAVLGTVLSALGGRNSFMGGRVVFMYFTIQSNIAIAIVCTVGLFMMLSGRPYYKAWQVIKLVGTVSITLTGTVFCFVLAPTMGSRAWNVQNVLTHVIVPVTSVIDFFVTGVISDIKKSSVVYVTLPPLAYVIYAGIGYVQGWEFSRGVHYPYFFLNWGSPTGVFGFSGSFPFIGTGWWILLLSVLLILVSLLYLAILKKLKAKRSRNIPG